MSIENYNNEFFSWQGSISRKNYAINMGIVISLYVVLSFVNFQAFAPFIPIKFLLTILVFMAGLLKLVLLMSMLSLIFRRIVDFAGTKPYKFQLAMRRVFVFLYVVPAFYLLFVRSFFVTVPIFIYVGDFVIFFVCLPIALISAIVFCFIKGLNK